MTCYCTVCHTVYTELDDITRHQNDCKSEGCQRHGSTPCDCPQWAKTRGYRD